ncbi:fimbria/pilus outer membrane usher protein, partial [Shigella flexneri]
ENMKQLGANLSGGILITRDGLTFGQNVDGTLALIEAPGATGVNVNGWPGLSTDFRGYAILPVQPYRRDDVIL